MLDQMTVNKLHEMRLSAMANAFHDQIQDQALTSLSFEERFGLIVDIEWAKRKNNRLTRLPELFNDLTVARGEGTYKNVIKDYKKISLLVLDEWLLMPLSSLEA